MKHNKLKEELNQLITNRLINFSCAAYLNLNKEMNFDNVPVELKKIWYEKNSLSFTKLYSCSDKKINSLNEQELLNEIEKEKKCLYLLENIFAKLKGGE